MSRKDYVAVAAVLRGVTLTPSQRAELVQRFADLFTADNERFDRERFSTAAGVTETDEAQAA